MRISLALAAALCAPALLAAAQQDTAPKTVRVETVDSSYSQEER